MHLHGFYYRVRPAATGTRTAAPPAPTSRSLNTDLMPPGGTLTLSLQGPRRRGTGCSTATSRSIWTRRHAGRVAPGTAEHAARPRTRARAMRGLVIGISGDPAAGIPRGRCAAETPRESGSWCRAARARSPPEHAAYGFVVQRATASRRATRSRCRPGARAGARKAGAHHGGEQPRRADRDPLARAGDRELPRRRARLERHRRPDLAAGGAGRLVRRGVHARRAPAPIPITRTRTSGTRSSRDVRRAHRAPTSPTIRPATTSSWPAAAAPRSRPSSKVLCAGERTLFPGRSGLPRARPTVSAS